MTQLSLTLQRDPASLFWDKTWIIKLMRKKKIPKDTAVLAVELPLAKFQQKERFLVSQMLTKAPWQHKREKSRNHFWVICITVSPVPASVD